MSSSNRAQISLLEYLQTGLLPLSLPPADLLIYEEYDETTIPYDPEEIHQETVWRSFTLDAIMERHKKTLQQAQVQSEMPLDFDDVGPARSQNSLCMRFASMGVIARTRRGLRAAFNLMEQSSGGLGNLERIVCNHGGSDMLNYIFEPYASFLPNSDEWNPEPNRGFFPALGIVLTSWEWDPTFGHSENIDEQNKYWRGLNKINFGMRLNGAQYGFMLTDKVLVVLRRLNGNGDLDIAPAIPVTVEGSVETPQLTVLLALWYLGMLAAEGLDEDV